LSTKYSSAKTDDQLSLSVDLNLLAELEHIL
jgi:hypothetical protein